MYRVVREFFFLSFLFFCSPGNSVTSRRKLEEGHANDSRVEAGWWRRRFRSCLTRMAMPRTRVLPPPVLLSDLNQRAPSSCFLVTPLHSVSSSAHTVCCMLPFFYSVLPAVRLHSRVDHLPSYGFFFPFSSLGSAASNSLLSRHHRPTVVSSLLCLFRSSPRLRGILPSSLDKGWKGT